MSKHTPNKHAIYYVQSENNIERPAVIRGRPTYRLVVGYHRVWNGRITYPAMTRSECIVDADRENGVPKFLKSINDIP